MKSIKEMAEEHAPYTENDSWNRIKAAINAQISFEAGGNYVLDAITQCMPKTHSFNPNEVIDVIASMIKELKK